MAVDGLATPGGQQPAALTGRCTAEVQSRVATSVCQLRHGQMGQGPTEPHSGCSTFLLRSGGAGGGYYTVDAGPITTENRFFPARHSWHVWSSRTGAWQSFVFFWGGGGH